MQPLVAKENSRSQRGSARAQLTVKTEWNFKDKIQLMQVHRGNKKNLRSVGSLCTSWWFQRPVGGRACSSHSDPYSPHVKHLLTCDLFLVCKIQQRAMGCLVCGCMIRLPFAFVPEAAYSYCLLGL